MPDNTSGPAGRALVVMPVPDPQLTCRTDVPDGWYIQIDRQYAAVSLAVGPYRSEQVADSALVGSLLIDGFCETDCLDATTLTAADLDPVVEVVVIDNDDPDHFGSLR